MGAENADLVIAETRILPAGDLIGWKKWDVYIRVRASFPDDWFICRLSLGNGAVMANANLLSAAPEMAEALETVVAEAMQHGQGRPLSVNGTYCVMLSEEQFASVVAALAKARGEK